MTAAELDMVSVRHSPDARAIVARWRGLTGGPSVRDRDRRTLVACSGGADSAALLLALAGAGPAVVVGHIVHDLRDRASTLAECHGVRDLAVRLGLDFVEAEVAVRAESGNAEGNARRARYAQLERLAFEAGCPFVATGHQANDQLETMLMAMFRGAGVRGMGGIPPRRNLGGRGIRLVRPMLAIDRTRAEALCTLAGVVWATDATNADLSRLRAAIRHGPAAEVLGLRPGAAGRISATASNLRAAAAVLEASHAGIVDRASRSADSLGWPRDELRHLPGTILAGALREAFRRLLDGRHTDRLGARALREAARAIRDREGNVREFHWRGACLWVGPEMVTLRKESDGA
ncbi:MAG: tRNA lysidine(34) synthetase TilS [Phycisphaerales bacterium]|nr:tRNA lysidine(34) synthetase TilS [Phycisphaerales bacterium]